MLEKIKINPTTGHLMLKIGLTIALCVAVMGFGVTSAQAEGVLKIGVYGGYFKDSFDRSEERRVGKECRSGCR